MQKAKLFTNGHSQVVRLPEEFRMPGKDVRISRQGTGVLIEPIAESFDALFRSLDDFSEAENGVRLGGGEWGQAWRRRMGSGLYR